MRISISGIGVVGGFGCGLQDLETALATRKSPFSDASFRTSQGTRRIRALLADTTPLETFIPVRSLRRVDHFSRMALLGACLALRDAGGAGITRERVGLVMASGYGATRTTCAFLDSVIKDGDASASPTLFSNSVHNAAAGHISILLGLHGPSLTVSGFDMSVPSAFLSASSWLEDGRVDAVLVGAVDEYCELLGYCRHRFSEGLQRGPVRSGGTDPQDPVPGEGAAFFLLSRKDSGPSPYGYMTDIQMGKPGDRGIPLPEAATVIIGECQGGRTRIDYETIVRPPVDVATYTSLYGSLPIGPAFDMAVASLSMKTDTLFAAPGAGAYQGRMNIVRENRRNNGKSFACLTLGREGDYGLITLMPG